LIEVDGLVRLWWALWLRCVVGVYTDFVYMPLEQVQRTSARGEDRDEGDGVGVGHDVGMHCGRRGGGKLDGGDERGGVERDDDGDELV
jgi:hypothetical protein